MAYDLVVRNGVIIDGTGGPPIDGDVAVEGETISDIGKNLGPGRVEIDAGGKVISPGFIDAHTHMDLFLVLYPHGNPVVNYGVTTVVIGDCGASVAPVPDGEEPVKVLVAYLRRVLDDYIDDKAWQWKTFPEYLRYLDGRVGINVAALMPHSPVRLGVMGEAAYQRAARPDELEAMKQVVREGMEAGAIGFSTSPRGGPLLHAGTPSTFAEHDEIAALAGVAAEYGGCFQFNAFSNILKPESGFPDLLERIPAALIGNEFRIQPGRRDQAIASISLMEQAAKRGKDMFGVVIPYQHFRRFSAEDLFLFDGLPTWDSIKSSGDDLCARLRDSAIRRQIEHERVQGAGGPAFPDWRGWGAVVFERMENSSLKWLETKSVEAAARANNREPVDVFFDALLDDNLRSRFVYYGFANADMDILADMIKSPTGLIGTDAGAHLDRFFFHGAPARVLGYWCREKKLFSLEEAVWKVTGHPAAKLNISRGRVKAGWPADIVVFDPDTIDDLLGDRLPAKLDKNEVQRHPTGIQDVVVAGQIVVEHGECRDVYPGKVTRQELRGLVPA